MSKETTNKKTAKPLAKRRDDAEHYVNNAELLKHMKVYVKSVRAAKRNKLQKPQIPDFIGECILAIANKLANKPNFMNYPFRDEMIADGIENTLMYIDNFDPRKSSNPFAYFTQIIYWAFVRRIQKEKKHLYTKYKMIEEKLTHDMNEEDHTFLTQYGSDYSDNYMHEFVENFEKGKEAKKLKAKKKKELDLDDVIDS